MTAKLEEVKLLGIGYVLDPINENELVSFDEFMITQALENYKYKKSDSTDQGSIPIGADWSFKCTFKGINAALMQKIVGGTLATTANADILMEGSGTIPATTPFTATLDHIPIMGSTEYSFRIWKIDSNSNIDYFERVTGTPTTGQYAISGAGLTFAEADAGISYYYKGYYAGSSDASSITIAPTDDLPGPLTFKAVLVAVTNGNKRKSISVLMKNVQRTSPFSLGGPVQEIAKFTYEGDISVISSGDIVIKFQNP
jgi:hypothetical protein